MHVFTRGSRSSGEPAERSPAASDTGEYLTAVYRLRFSDRDEARKQGIWLEIGRYLQRFVPAGARVLDIGSDSGYFVSSIKAAEKVATDIRDVSSTIPPDVRFVESNSLELNSVLPSDYFDVILISNFLEHLDGGQTVVEQLRVTLKLLRRGGRVIILQPNIRLTKEAYWDFIDHKAALNERSLMEAAELAGFRHYKVVKRFLPYTTRSRLPQSRLLVRGYLAFRPAWWLLGKQTLYIGEKP